MLDRLAADHFTPLLHQTLRLGLPDGSALATRVDSIQACPQARMPHAPADRRMPFTVTLTALEATGFAGGPCTMELPEWGLVQGIWVERLAAMGRDHGGAYFQVVFN